MSCLKTRKGKIQKQHQNKYIGVFFFKLFFFLAEGDWQFAPDISIVITTLEGRVLYEGVNCICVNNKNSSSLSVFLYKIR